MGKHSKKNHNRNWKTEQQDLATRAKMVLIHDADAVKLKFRDGRMMERLPNGQLVRVYPKTKQEGFLAQ